MQIQWESKNSFFLDSYIKKNTTGWGKISYGLIGEIDGQKEIIKYTDEVDLTNYDLYIKKTIHRIQAIFLLMIIARPVKTIIKTCYHICLPISIPNEIYNAILKEKDQLTFKDALWVGTIAAVKSMADIIRTPLYGATLTVIVLAGAVISFIQPAWLNDARKLHGKVELGLYWGNKHRCLVQCFVPMENLMKIERRNRLIEGISECQIKAYNKPKSNFTNREYDHFSYKIEGCNPVILGLANWAHSQFTKSQSIKTSRTKIIQKFINVCL